HILIKFRKQSADLGVHDLVLDIGVHGEQFDDLPGEPGLRFDRPVTGGLELAEQAAYLVVVGLQQHDRVRCHGPPPSGSRCWHTAPLKIVSGAATVVVGTANVGDNLIRVSPPVNSGVRPILAGRGPVLLYLDATGQSGPAAVHILLNPHVIWRLTFAGGTSLTTVNLGQGRVRSVDFAAGSSVIQMTLPRPAGTASVV